jgi:hypothetical protein
MLISNIITRLLFVATVAVVNTSPPFAGDVGQESTKPGVKWVVEKSSTLRVEGKSNINTFRCDMAGYFQTDTISSANDGATGKPVRLKGAIVIEILRFDCHHRMITNDLRKTLKAESYPRMTIRFLSLERLPEFIGSAEIVKGIVEIELAGSRKKFDILYSFVKPGGNIIYLNGGRTFSFADFKLVPPRKLGGMIQISDAFDVNFRLTLTPVK